VPWAACQADWDDNGKIGSENRHDHHGRDENGSGPAVQISTLARDHGDGPGDEGNHASADVKNIGE
jgi:hypothetical protein